VGAVYSFRVGHASLLLATAQATECRFRTDSGALGGLQHQGVRPLLIETTTIRDGNLARAVHEPAAVRGWFRSV
jgi:hypothetical protein